MPYRAVRLSESLERIVEGKVLLKRGRRMGRQAERMPILSSTLSQMPASTTESVLDQSGIDFVTEHESLTYRRRR